MTHRRRQITFAISVSVKQQLWQNTFALLIVSCSPPTFACSVINNRSNNQGKMLLQSLLVRAAATEGKFFCFSYNRNNIHGKILLCHLYLQLQLKQQLKKILLLQLDRKQHLRQNTFAISIWSWRKDTSASVEKEATFNAKYLCHLCLQLQLKQQSRKIHRLQVVRKQHLRQNTFVISNCS